MNPIERQSMSSTVHREDDGPYCSFGSELLYVPLSLASFVRRVSCFLKAPYCSADSVRSFYICEQFIVSVRLSMSERTELTDS